MPLARAAWTVVAGLLVAAPLAASQVGVFGTLVKVGDADHTPVTKAASIAVGANEADFGDAGVAKDDCILVDIGPTLTGGAFTAGAQNKDIRLTPCMGKGPGTPIDDADVTEKQSTWAQRGTNAAPSTLNLQYADVNSDGKWGKGDYLYLVSNPTAAAGAAGLAPTAATGTWSVRITPTAEYAAGTLVLPSDVDLVKFAGAVRIQAFSLVEREDKQWYLVPFAAAAAPFAARGADVTENAVRLGGAPALQPTFKVVGLADAPAGPVPAGDSLAVRADVQNTGKAAGIGVIVAKVNGLAQDVRATNLLSPGENQTLSFKVLVPKSGRIGVLEVGEKLVRLEISGGDGDASAVDALAAKVTQLEARVAALEAAAAAGGALEAQQARAEMPRGAPSVGTLAVVVGVGVVAIGLAERRRTG